ncbi:hypothetical protein Pcinc_015808 [Petrolisthes cinctipes]|uniref:Methyltransferase FkbM domain-containing protein n=1 Tax=Petrolisthes cinctipes TaxID=88211 RepID=A0AAE1KQC3_PETCI|nr:hypothetical protein Pcinc_015808 [Petrolisthes cinctipes]
MMLYQMNVIVNVLLLVLTTLVLMRYLSSTSLLLFHNECDLDCIDTYFMEQPKHNDPEVIEMVREKYLMPPPPDPDTSPFDVNKPIWARLVDWNLMQDYLKTIWKGQPPGVFVEVGASDGEFLSQTLMLERNLGWSGLLVEPDPRAFTILQQRRRRAWTTPLCVHENQPCMRKYWLRDVDDDLPKHFQQLLMARSRLQDDTLIGDEERGGTVSVPCVPLSTILLAANITSIDFLTAATGVQDDDTRIAHVIHSKKFDVKTLSVHYPTGRLFKEPYPIVPGYILDMEHSTLLTKLYIKRSHCKLISDQVHKKIHNYDSVAASLQYNCFNFLTVYTHKFIIEEN